MIIIGLGNPGKKYEKTRHNAGFLALEKIRKNWDFPDFKLEKKFNAEISKDKKGEREVILFKPQTFMNNSGDSVRSILDFYKLYPNDILVIHDDLDIPLGKTRIAVDSRSAGHNGVQNIIDTLGTQKFKRIRIGIGKPPEKKSSCPHSGHDFVLGKFSPEELEILEKALEKTEKETKNTTEK